MAPSSTNAATDRTIKRRRSDGVIVLERQTLAIHDVRGVVAYVETRSVDAGTPALVAQSDTKPGPHKTENTIRGVSKTHEWGKVFDHYATQRFGRINKYTGN